MRQFIEFIPIALFVAVYFTTRDFYIATGVFMAGVTAQVAIEYLFERSVRKQTQIIFWIAILAGGATIALHDERFLKWKPTIMNWIFCLALIGSHFLSKENLLKKMLGSQLSLPDHVWRNLAFGWSAGFFIAGALNLVVAYSFSTDFWVTYKLVGGFAITLVYMIITMVYLVKGGYIKDLDESEEQTQSEVP